VPELVHQRVFGPLGLKRIGWSFTDPEILAEIASIVEMGWLDHLAELQGWMEMQSVAGGLIASARDLQCAARCCCARGVWRGANLIPSLCAHDDLLPVPPTTGTSTHTAACSGGSKPA